MATKAIHWTHTPAEIFIHLTKFTGHLNVLNMKQELLIHYEVLILSVTLGNSSLLKVVQASKDGYVTTCSYTTKQ